MDEIYWGYGYPSTDNCQNWLYCSCYKMGSKIPASAKFPKGFQNPLGLKSQNNFDSFFFFLNHLHIVKTNSGWFLFQNASFIHSIVFLCIVIRKTQTLLTLQIRHCQTLLSGLSSSNLSLPLCNRQRVDIHKMLSYHCLLRNFTVSSVLEITV